MARKPATPKPAEPRFGLLVGPRPGANDPDRRSVVVFETREDAEDFARSRSSRDLLSWDHALRPIVIRVWVDPKAAESAQPAMFGEHEDRTLAQARAARLANEEALRLAAEAQREARAERRAELRKLIEAGETELRTFAAKRADILAQWGDLAGRVIVRAAEAELPQLAARLEEAKRELESLADAEPGDEPTTNSDGDDAV